MGARRSAKCAVFVTLISYCWCLAEYELFPGFSSTTNAPSEKLPKKITSKDLQKDNKKPFSIFDYDYETKDEETSSKFPPYIKIGTEHSTVVNKTYLPKNFMNSTKRHENTLNGKITTTSNKPFVCPEEETPANIGPYEVPTQRDLVRQVKKTLRVRFKSYHKKVLNFLNDIQEANKGTKEIQARCPSMSRQTYMQCVKHVTNQCQTITKTLASSLELQRHDVEAFTEASICNLSSMKADPVQLIKIIAMEEASLEFALAGFLRLLSACENYCHNTTKISYTKKPVRHMSDQDLVIRHFLTRKNYIQLVKGT